jgi:hypothetical protein
VLTDIVVEGSGTRRGTATFTLETGTTARHGALSVCEGAPAPAPQHPKDALAISKNSE